MVDLRRGPGRPAYGSKEKILASMSTLLAEYGYAQTSPKMVIAASGLGHGSLYHHFANKEALALATIDQMRTKSISFIEGQITASDATGQEKVGTLSNVEVSLTRLFAKREGQALIRLLSDQQIAAIPNLRQVVQLWCDELRREIFRAIAADTAAENSMTLAAELIPPETQQIINELLGKTIGAGLLNLPQNAQETDAENAEHVGGVV